MSFSAKIKTENGLTEGSYYNYKVGQCGSKYQRWNPLKFNKLLKKETKDMIQASGPKPKGQCLFISIHLNIFQNMNICPRGRLDYAGRVNHLLLRRKQEKTIACCKKTRAETLIPGGKPPIHLCSSKAVRSHLVANSKVSARCTYEKITTNRLSIRRFP